jgi:hypothetical protein
MVGETSCIDVWQSGDTDRCSAWHRNFLDDYLAADHEGALSS